MPRKRGAIYLCLLKICPPCEKQFSLRPSQPDSANKMNQKKSAELFEKAKTYFPGGVNSPVRAFRSVGGTPLFIERGNGSRIWDADGNEFIDFCGSWGPLILGHNHPAVREKIVEAVNKGASFGAPTAVENELAELILSHNR